VPSYAVAALIAMEEDVICLTSRVMARHLVERGVPLRWYELPFDLPAVDVEFRWHRRVDDDAASRWLRGHVCGVVEPLAAGEPLPQ
jgi:hypothetical protein